MVLSFHHSAQWPVRPIAPFYPASLSHVHTFVRIVITIAIIHDTELHYRHHHLIVRSWSLSRSSSSSWLIITMFPPNIAQPHHNAHPFRSHHYLQHHRHPVISLIVSPLPPSSSAFIINPSHMLSESYGPICPV